MILFSLLCDVMMNPHVVLFMMVFAHVKLNPWKTNFVILNGSQTLNAFYLILISQFFFCFFF